MLNEVGDHQQDANDIIQRAMYGSFKGETWKRLANFTDLVSTQSSTQTTQHSTTLTAQRIKHTCRNPNERALTLTLTLVLALPALCPVHLLTSPAIVSAAVSHTRMP